MVEKNASILRDSQSTSRFLKKATGVNRVPDLPQFVVANTKEILHCGRLVMVLNEFRRAKYRQDAQRTEMNGLLHNSASILFTKISKKFSYLQAKIKSDEDNLTSLQFKQ